MVKRGQRRPWRTARGFGLIEILIALLLLSIGLLGVAGSTVLATRIMREAESTERAAFEALSLIDSLARVRDPLAGERQTGSMRIAWSTAADSNGVAWIEVSVFYADGTIPRAARYRVAQVRP